jgi:hypothetical protein
MFGESASDMNTGSPGAPTEWIPSDPARAKSVASRLSSLSELAALGFGWPAGPVSPLGPAESLNRFAPLRERATEVRKVVGGSYARAVRIATGQILGCLLTAVGGLALLTAPVSSHGRGQASRACGVERTRKVDARPLPVGRLVWTARVI